MFDLLVEQPLLFSAVFLAGMIFKSLIVNKIKSYVIKKVSPGIIKNYLEEVLGINSLNQNIQYNPNQHQHNHQKAILLPYYPNPQKQQEQVLYPPVPQQPISVGQPADQVQVLQPQPIQPPQALPK